MMYLHKCNLLSISNIFEFDSARLNKIRSMGGRQYYHRFCSESLVKGIKETRVSYHVKFSKCKSFKFTYVK